MMRDKLRALIAQLRLHASPAVLDAEIERAEHEAIAAPECCIGCSVRKPRSRQERSLAYRLRQAHLPCARRSRPFRSTVSQGLQGANPDPRRVGLPAPGGQHPVHRETRQPARPMAVGLLREACLMVTAAASTMHRCCSTSCTPRWRPHHHEATGPDEPHASVGHDELGYLTLNRNRPTLLPADGSALQPRLDDHHYKPRSADWYDCSTRSLWSMRCSIACSIIALPSVSTAVVT